MTVNPASEPTLEADLQDLARSVRSIVGSLKRGAAPPEVFHRPFERARSDRVTRPCSWRWPSRGSSA